MERNLSLIYGNCRKKAWEGGLPPSYLPMAASDAMPRRFGFWVLSPFSSSFFHRRNPEMRRGRMIIVYGLLPPSLFPPSSELTKISVVKPNPWPNGEVLGVLL